MRFLLAALVWAAFSLPVQARMLPVACNDADIVRSALKGKYGERPVGVGKTNARAVGVLWRNDKTGSWSFVIAYATGMWCIVAAGKGGFDFVPAKKGARG